MITPRTMSIVDTLRERAGQFIRIEYFTNPAPAAAHKFRTLTKRTTMIVRTGVDFANLTSVKMAIAAGERGEVQPLAWGEWAMHPWVITHKGAEYLRVTIDGIPNHASSFYEVDGQPVSRGEFLALLTPAKRAEAESGQRPEVLTIKAENIVSLAGIEV